MKSLFKKKLPPIVGLDIGTRQIKAVLIERTAKGFVLQAFACESINKRAFNEREIKDFDAVSLALKKIKKALKTKVKSVSIAVAGSSVISKVVPMDPEQSDFELEGQIEIEADSLIPYPLEEVYLDFEVLGPSPTHAGKDSVLLTAAHKDLVDSRITLVREIPYEPKVVDMEVYALSNALFYFHPLESEEERVCCINLGASLLQLCVWQNGEVIYTKEHAFGTNQLIQDLAAINMLEPDEAERQVMEGSLPGNWQQDTLPIFVANLQQQILRAIQMYVSTLHAQRPEKIVLSGGGATIPELVDGLRQDLGMDVEVFNPFDGMTINPKLDQERLMKLAPQLVTAAGLASRSFTEWHI
ncbi:type IV pilus assembly protein PilM [Alteromonas confluentis]|uniref:Pilus assembly protein PilM n=1 Tax=Alteromonas confluentis TaxID=1656094 RepID=A0A1E7Z850_9ALTE|nr:type IV pilus assembly protein PilM [Alteromonas confluentis]OFC69725.1 pilus assembly protein PilM [Alteromonas confluentis]